MDSCVNALSYSSADSSRGIDPAMHIINSLGLPKPGGYASANYFSSTKPINPSSSLTAPDKVAAFTFSKHSPENIGNLNYETAYTPKTYRPTSAYSFNSSSNKSGSLDPMGFGIVRSYSQTSQEGKKSRRSGGSSENGVDPDENNNFMRDHRGRFCQCPDRVCERNPSERICQLAQPKRLPCAYQEDRCIYWTYKRRRPNCGNHTHFETTPRLDELAMPKPLIVDCCASHTSCDMSCWCHAHPHGETDPRCVDWDRLAAPKLRCPANYRPIQHVRRAALKAEPTKRLCKLSAPKPVIDVAKFYLWLWQKKPDTKIQLTKVLRLFIAKCHLADMRVMVRCDLDPSTGGGVEAKLAAVIPTMKYALAKGAKSVIIVSNCPPPKLPGSNLPDMKAASLKPLTARFQELLATNVLFLDDCVGYQARALCQDPEPGNVFLLENLAFHPEETGKGIDDKGQEYICPKEKVETFRKEFFHLADTYVIESFRELVDMTNSTVGFPHQDKAYGFKVKTELDNYNMFVARPYQPMVAIVGGPIKDTFLIIRNLMGIATDIVVGGETALVFLRALKRTDLGRINITPKMEKKALNLHARAKDTRTGLLLPSDVVVRHMQSGQFYTVLTREDVDDDYEIVDIGPFTRRCYIKVIQKAETLLWWGDMGSLGDGTSAIAAAFVQAAQRGARTYVAENTSGATIVNTSEWGTKTRVTEDSVATTMLLKGKLPKGLAGLNPYRRKIKKREPAAPPISRKPIKYDIPGMEIPSGEKIMCISDINLEGKNVLIRLDTNVQMQGNKVLNNYRIRMAVPTIRYALKWRARTVVIMGHLGMPEGKREDSLSLKPICDELASLLGFTVVFVPETVGKQAEAAIAGAHAGTVIMLENVRFNLEETGSGTSKGGLMWKSTRAEATPQAIATFCEKMSRLGDVYVNDAFPCAIYDHSSIMSFYQPTRVCGFLLKNELKYMARICNFPQRRLLVVLGGNSFKEKIPLLRDLMREADDIILVGAIGVAFLKVYLNTSIGSTMYDSSYEQDIRSIIDLADYYSCRLFYPVDLTIASNKNGDNLKQVSITEQIPEGQMVIDIGDLTSGMFCRLISKSKMVFWVGTAGIAEVEAGSKGSKKIMDAIIEATRNPEAGIISIIGGHSTCSFVHKFETGHDSFTHMSTGSIAAFKLLTDRYLSGIDKLMPKPRNRPLRMLGVDQVDVTDKRVLLRADLTVPIVEGKVVDTFPLTQLIATVKYLLKKGVRSIVILGSRGEPDGKVNPELSLLPLKEVLEVLVEQEVYFAEDGVSEQTEAASKTRRLVLVENMKFHPEEAGIKEDPNGFKIKVAYDVLEAFRARMTSLGDIYVNESLCSLHLKYSSLIGIGNIKKVAGLNLKRTLLKFEEIKKNMERPVLAILGGSDSQTDIARLFDLLDSVDEVILCGDLGLTILKAETGAKLGKFKYDPSASKLIPRVLSKARANNISLHLPVDLVADEDPNDVVSKVATPAVTPAASMIREGTQPPSRDERVTLFSVSGGIPDEYTPLDIGAETVSIFTDVILQAKMILFHGVVTPFYTFERYQDGSRAILDAVQAATANGSQSVAMGSKAMCLINKLNYMEAFSLCDHGVQMFWDMLRGRSLPGLQILEDAPGRPLKKLSMEQMDLTNLRVLMRLDLFVPTVEGVVIDTDKLEEAAPTIMLALKKGAKSVVLLGHRGNPNGYKNNYLSMKPLLVDLSQILERPVTMIDRPCSKKAKKLLADPEPGSVFLMENLKFYPAEYGIDAELKESRSRRATLAPGDSAETKESDQEAETAAEKEDEQESSSVTVSTETISDGEGGKNIDSVMFQLMTPKTVAEYSADLAQCGDVFVNDDLTDIAETLTSLQGFGLPQRGCGLLLASYLSEMDDPEVYNLPGVASLSPAPR